MPGFWGCRCCGKKYATHRVLSKDGVHQFRRKHVGAVRLQTNNEGIQAVRLNSAGQMTVYKPDYPATGSAIKTTSTVERYDLPASGAVSLTLADTGDQVWSYSQYLHSDGGLIGVNPSKGVIFRVDQDMEILWETQLPLVSAGVSFETVGELYINDAEDKILAPITTYQGGFGAQVTGFAILDMTGSITGSNTSFFLS